MLFRYRTNSDCTIDDFKADLHRIITGNFTDINDFSNGANKTHSQIIGTYPSSIYTAVDAASYTYSKAHNDYAGVTHYFRLGFSADALTTLTLARSYDGDTNTLINSQDVTDEFKSGEVTAAINITGSNYHPDYGQAFLSTTRTIGDRIQVKYPQVGEQGNLPGLQILPGTRMVTTTQVSRLQTSTNQLLETFTESTDLNIRPVAWNSTTNRAGIDIIITDKCLVISAPQCENAGANTAANGSFGVHVAMFDLGKSGISRTNTDSMLMCSLDLDARLCKVPYHYRLDTRAYGSLIDQPIIGEPSLKQFNSSGETVIVENPTYMQQIHSSGAVSNIYGLYRVPPAFIENYQLYQEFGGSYRWYKDGFAIITE